MINQKRDAFSTCHPLVNFYYFFVVILCAMFFLHPVLMVISLMSGLAYAFYLNGNKAVRFTIFGIIPIFLVAAFFNPLFSHAGITTLFFLRNGNPVTLESVLYGLAMGGMLVSVITWFTCFNKLMTSDKLIFLFGKFIPALSLIFSMTLRLVPRLKHQIGVIAHGQKCLGRGISDGHLGARLKNGMNIISILMTWALENGIETATSMKSRGYGLKGRTHFFIFRFEKRDKMILTFMISCTIIMAVGSYLGRTRMQFFPKVIMPPPDLWSIVIYVLFLVLVSIPLILNMWEDMKWKAIKSKI